MEQVIDRFYYTKPMEELFALKLKWDLREDLTLICSKYQSHMSNNRKVIHILMREFRNVPELRALHKHPKRLKELLVDYLNRMRDMGKIIPCSTESQAMNFMCLNHGRFTTMLYSGEAIFSVSDEQFLKDCVDLFVRGLTP
jgi:hypothetical protein